MNLDFKKDWVEHICMFFKTNGYNKPENIQYQRINISFFKFKAKTCENF